MNSNLVTVSVIMGTLSLIMVLIVVVLPQWRINSRVASDPNMNMIQAFEGLWIRCTSYAYAYWNCDNYDKSLIGLPAYLNAFRALMIVSFVASVVGVVTSILGMKCASVIEEESNTKRWVIIVGGVCHITSGVLTCICVSWYAAEVIREYNNPYYVNQPLKYELGACIYLGWISFIFAMATGCMMACCTCFSKSTGSETYTPATSNYVYTAKEPTVYKEPAYEYKQTMSYDTKPDYYEKKDSSRHYSRQAPRSSSRPNNSSRRHDRASSRRHDSFTSNSSDEGHKPNRGGSRHDSEVIRASGFV